MKKQYITGHSFFFGQDFDANKCWAFVNKDRN